MGKVFGTFRKRFMSWCKFIVFGVHFMCQVRFAFIAKYPGKTLAFSMRKKISETTEI